MTAAARVLDGRPRDLGGFRVRRVLPAAGLQTVGPFIFLDHLGPAALAPGSGVDVPPHPHIGLATVTYLFEGELMHRDSVGTVQRIRAGDLNWMVAGRGIVHSERTPPEARSSPGGARIHGIQAWVALPREREETAPSFEHHPSGTLPEILVGGAVLRLVAGDAWGRRAPASVFSPMFYVDASLETDAEVACPADPAECAAYVVQGEIEAAGCLAGQGQMIVFAPSGPRVIRARAPARLMLLGGAPLDGPRFIWWNFVASSRERIERARDDWSSERFEPVPGETERTPLPAG